MYGKVHGCQDGPLGDPEGIGEWTNTVTHENTYLQANLQMELTGTGDDVLTTLRDPCLDARVGLRETLETFDKLGEIGGVLDLNSDLDDGRDGEPHDPHVVRGLGGSESTALEQELVNADKTNDVTGGTVLNRLDGATHHENGTLDGLDEEVILLAGDEVGSLNTDLGAGTDGTREDTTEGVEATLIGSGHHLGDVQAQRAVRVTFTDTDGSLIVHGTLVEGLNTVALSGGGRGEVDDYHLQEGVTVCSTRKLVGDDTHTSLASHRCHPSWWRTNHSHVPSRLLRCLLAGRAWSPGASLLR